HRFDNENARHHRRAGKMSLKKLFVRGDVLDADDPLAGVDFQHAIDQQHRIAMRKDLHDVGDRQRRHRYLFFASRRFSIMSRRAYSRNSIAGLPITFVPSGMSWNTAAPP